MFNFDKNFEEKFAVAIETPLKNNIYEYSCMENIINKSSKCYLNNCNLKKLEENSNIRLIEKSDTQYEISNSLYKKFLENSYMKKCDLTDFDKKKQDILEKKINEIYYWENKIKNLSKKKKIAIKNKVKSHLELMKYNDSRKKLEKIEYLKNNKINEQLAILARAEYAKEVIERNIKSKKIVKEDNINFVILSLENLKKHIEYTYLNKEKEKKNNFFSL
ncbi:hypothetical protein PGAL8A_00354600 [Plasmodium gallinaceum]|uniref:Uncharacterized protein n=1 Tax=Plasmodium gallinaceum TaxID=5849 RepID=A0A1J1GYG1_PLAGA|nr:hypothetical protein PGAL8A_00354600 [Plasmodium gallinaceum]CRG96328.1 hypothetical protein PGAL8A_00354600 [Plasmodium gallinaceum]